MNTGIDRGFGIIPTLYTTDARNPTEQLAHDKFDTDVYAVFGQLAYDLTDTIETSLALRYDREERDVDNQVPRDGAPPSTSTPATRRRRPGTGGARSTPGLCATGSIPRPERRPSTSSSRSCPSPGTPRTASRPMPRPASASRAAASTTRAPPRRSICFINDPLLGPGGPFEGEYAAACNIEDTYRRGNLLVLRGRPEDPVAGRPAPRRSRPSTTSTWTTCSSSSSSSAASACCAWCPTSTRWTSRASSCRLNFAATDWLSLYAGANFNNTEIKKNDARPDSVGNESPYTPDYTWSAGAQVQYPLSADYDFVGSVDVSGVGETWFHVIQDNDRPTIFSLAFPLGAANYSRSPARRLLAGQPAGRRFRRPLVAGGLHQERLRRELPGGSDPGAGVRRLLHPARARSAGSAWRPRSSSDL